MKYKCTNKECFYRYKGQAHAVPDVCPQCKSKLKKIFGAKNKGSHFEREVAGHMNTVFGLTGDNRVSRMPLSGGASGLRGDLRNLPDVISTMVVECKNQKNLAIKQWWEQSKEEGKQMAKNPWLVIRLEDGTVLSIKELSVDLKYLQTIRKLKGIG